MLTAHETSHPLLIIGGENDHTVPLVLTRSQFKHQEKNPGATKSVELPNRGHKRKNIICVSVAVKKYPQVARLRSPVLAG